MGVLLPAIGIAGAGIQAVGMLAQSSAASSSASYQSQVAKNNADIARQNAGWEYESGDIQSDNAARHTRNVVGATKAGQAASGVDVNTGSSVDVRAAESELGALDALTTRSNTARKAYGYEVAAYSQDEQSKLYENEATSIKSLAPVSALGSFLSSAYSVGSNWSRYSSLRST